MDSYQTPDVSNQNLNTAEKELLEYVLKHTDYWREWRKDEYDDKWKEVERHWLGIWDYSDVNRKSERAKTITPALQQAIETYSAEIVEAVFGRGQFFDIEETDEKSAQAVMQIRKNLNDDFKRDKVKQSICEIITLGAVFGTGLGEVLIDEDYYKEVGSQELIKGLKVGGVYEKERFAVKLNPIVPYNFLIDPTSTTIDDGLGVAVEEMVPAFKVVELQAEGIYRDIPLVTEENNELKTSVGQFADKREDEIQLLRFYGLVPRHLIQKVKDYDVSKESSENEELKNLQYDDNSNLKDYEDLVEACIVIGNGSILLRAEENRFMMRDRCIVAWSPEPIPGQFFGRGPGLKGMNMQKAIDQQVRSHLDATALTAAPMMGFDATRMPRGFKFEVYPGRSLASNGPPSEVFSPFKFGEPSDVNMNTASKFEQMLQQATGTIDSAGFASEMAGDTQAGTLSITLGGIIKKNKKALMTFQDSFLIPFINTAAQRYMQFDPDRYPAGDWKFIPMSTMGIMAREYEQQQYMAMLSTLGPESQMAPLLLASIVGNSSLDDREALQQKLLQMSQPDPQQQQMALQKAALEMAVLQGQAELLKEQAEKEKAQARFYNEQARLYEMKVTAEVVGDIARDSATPDVFDQKLQMTDRVLKTHELEIKAHDVAVKAQDSVNNVEIARIQAEASKNKKSD